MKVIKISGTKADSAIIQNSLEEFLCYNPVFIIDKDRELFKFIEELQVDDNYLYILKVAKEIEFEGIKSELRNKISDSFIKDGISSLSELLQEIDEVNADLYQFVIDTEDKVLVSDIIQSLIYLNLNLEVVMKKEKRDREVVQGFRSGFEKVKRTVFNAKRSILNLEVIDELLHEKENVLDILDDIEVDLDKAQERNLNIAVMATKKAGKSVVVNSFLGEQYAPTSLELPTPNTCIYKRSTDNRIKLVYDGQEIYFNSAEEIYKYTYNEFKRAQNDTEGACTIGDMEIYYANSKNDFASFAVVDTPGPNYAGAINQNNGANMHKKSAYQWIEKSDVVLFLVNYSNYLTLDEEEFFKDIKTQFEKHDKFYSLVVIVNKMDEMYMSECENKSVVRFLDYIRCRLHEMGYKGFVVFGTSARTYFDALKVSKIDDAELDNLSDEKEISKLRGEVLRARLKKIKRKYIGKPQMTVLSFVDDQLEKLECFHGMEDVGLDTLKEKSGIPKLMEYTSYIAIQKANIELFGSIIRSIDEKFVRIRNIDLIKSLIDTKNEKQDQIAEIEEMLQDMITSFEEIETEINEKISFNRLHEDLFTQIRASRDNKINYIDEMYESKIDNFFMKLRSKESDELKEIKNNGLSFNLSLNSAEIEEEFNSLIGVFLKQANDDLDQKEKALREFDSRIKEIVHIFSEKIKKEYNLKDFDITVPKIEHAFSRKSLVRIPQVNIDNIYVQERVIDSIEFKENMIERFINHFKEDKMGTYSMDSKKLREIKNSFLETVKANIKKEYVSSYSVLEGNLLSCINDLKGQIGKSIGNLTSTYKDIFNEILNDLSSSKMDVEEQMKYLDAKLEFLNDIVDRMSGFTEIWSKIRMD